MRSSMIMKSSAVVMGIAGVALLFAPDEILSALAVARTPGLSALAQIVAALLFGFAMTNWMASGSRVGGIYQRPLAVGNLAHFAIGALTLVRVAFHGGGLWIALTIAYALFAIAFASLVFGGGAADPA